MYSQIVVLKETLIKKDYCKSSLNFFIFFKILHLKKISKSYFQRNLIKNVIFMLYSFKYILLLYIYFFYFKRLNFKKYLKLIYY